MIAMIGNGATILALIVSRIMSHKDHVETKVSLDRSGEKLEVVHKLVNDRLDKAVEKIASLEARLSDKQKATEQIK